MKKARLTQMGAEISTAFQRGQARSDDLCQVTCSTLISKCSSESG